MKLFNFKNMTIEEKLRNNTLLAKILFGFVIALLLIIAVLLVALNLL